MGKKKHTYTGKYQKKIYVWLSIFFVMAQMMFSTAILIKTYDQQVKNNYEMNEQIFLQAANNVEQSDAVIKNMCKSLFVNPKVARILYGVMQEEEIYSWIREFQSVCSPILLSNPQIHSIYVYNRSMDRLFSSYRYMGFQDPEIQRLLEEGEEIPLLTPFVRTIEDGTGASKSTKVLTYVLYESADASGKPDGAIIVNVNFDVFTEEIRQLLTFSEEEKSEIFVFEHQKEILNWKKGDKSPQVAHTIQEMIDKKQIVKESRAFDLETARIDGEKYGILFINIPEMDWTIVKVQSYNEVFHNVNSQMMIVAVISAVFSVIMLLSTYFLAKKIYSPIGKLVEKVRVENEDEKTERNEIQYLSHVYEELFLKARETQMNYPKKKFMVNYDVQCLFMDGEKTDPAVWEELRTVDEVLFREDNEFGVCIVQIDEFQKWEKKFNYEEQELYKFVIENIFTEVLANHGYHSAMIPLEKDKIGILLHGNASGEEEYRKDMEACFAALNENLHKFIQISCSMAVSPYRRGAEEIHPSYRMADQKLPYRYALGKGTMIFYDYEPEQAGERQTAEVMEHLEAHLKSGEREKIREDFEKLGELVKRQESGRLMGFVIRQAVHILQMVETRERADNVVLGSAMQQRYTEILTLDNWQEISEQLEKLLTATLEPEVCKDQKTEFLIYTIRQMVQERYKDPNLCLQQISETLKMSGQYVGRIFKGAVGISVSEYINGYRLDKSVEIMAKTGCTVSEVLLQVGIENESQYYRLFKKKYGTTPKNYMLGICISDLEK